MTTFRDGVESLSDLQPGMILEGVKPGQIVKVKVLDVDVKRQRISLTIRLDDAPGTSSRSGGTAAGPRDQRPPEPSRAPGRE